MAWKQLQRGECIKEWSRVNPKLIKILLGISVSTKKDYDSLKAWHERDFICADNGEMWGYRPEHHNSLNSSIPRRTLMHLLKQRERLIISLGILVRHQLVFEITFCYHQVSSCWVTCRPEHRHVLLPWVSIFVVGTHTPSLQNRRSYFFF